MSELVYALTDDRIRLALHRIRPAATPARGAVLLQHGLAANGCSFLGGEPSRPALAYYLASRGYDCYVSELRGAGESQRPVHPWTLDDYLERDLPALLSAALNESGQPQIDVVGHSMGGVLSLLYGIEHPGAPLRRVVAVASSLDYAHSLNVYRALRRLRPLFGQWLSFLPYRLISRAAAPFAGLGLPSPPELLNFTRANVPREVCRDVLERGFEDIPLPLLDCLSTTFEPGGLHRPGSSLRHLDHAARFAFPTLLLGGSRDPQCPPAAIEQTRALLSGTAECDARIFGRSHGQLHHYGHFDLLLGQHADSEVFPTIESFLARDTSPAAGVGDARIEPTERPL